ncbi:MAG: flippase-like domain-containing protein [Boseongicola sp.]|nr:flippase-like domain-containing protein [Boseongicola sp.]RZW10196.1 MAG: flippase-like domain-containing protein [Paracoccaceae bacterium]
MPNSPRVPNAAASSRRWRDLALLAGLFLLLAIGLGALVSSTGWDETKAAVARLSILQIVILLALSLVNYLGRSLRWHLFARKLGLAIGFPVNALHFLGGFAMSVTPGRVGELVRMRWIRRHSGWSFDRTAPLALIDRAADLGALALLLAISAALSAGGIAGGAPVAVLGLLGAYIATRPALLKALGDGLFRLSGRRFPRLFARVRRAARSLGVFRGGGALAAGLIGVASWFAEGYAFYLLLTWMGAEVEMWVAVGIFIFATLAGGLTGAPGGLGGAEAAMVALLALRGVPLEIAVPATLIIRVTTLWFALLIGIVVFPIAEKHSKKAEDALERH